MIRFVVLLVIAAAIGWYFFRDQITDMIRQPTHTTKQMYRWKDDKGVVHYSSSQADAPRGAKPADLPEIGIVPAQIAPPEKQPKPAQTANPAQPVGDVDKPKPPQLRNLAIERMEKATEKIAK